jgi:hypothetical protein
VADVVFTAINNGLRLNIIEAFKTFLNLSSNSTITSNNYVVRVVKAEKVSTTTNNEILSVISTYDVLGSSVPNNILYQNEMVLNASLQNTEIILPSTTNNISNAPVIGDKILITFYYSTDLDSEDLYFTKNGNLYTNKKFAFIEELYISSGFSSSTSTNFLVSSFTQPQSGNRYRAFYDYLAPKQNERILIQYNYNSLIEATTFTVESSRPLNADVLVKAAQEFLVDATINIVLKSNYQTSSATVVQNVISKVTSTINTNTLGGSLNSSDLIVAAQSVDGVSRARIIYFNETGKAGQVLTLSIQGNQYFVANNVVVNTESI